MRPSVAALRIHAVLAVDHNFLSDGTDALPRVNTVDAVVRTEDVVGPEEDIHLGYSRVLQDDNMIRFRLSSEEEGHLGRELVEGMEAPGKAHRIEKLDTVPHADFVEDRVDETEVEMAAVGNRVEAAVADGTPRTLGRLGDSYSDIFVIEMDNLAIDLNVLATGMDIHAAEDTPDLRSVLGPHIRYYILLPARHKKSYLPCSHS